jgi:hypothetical protein
MGSKTGTTSIQQCLAQTQANGSLGSVGYPLWGSEHNHQRVAMLYRPHADLPRWMRAAHPTECSETWEQAFPGSLIVRKYPTHTRFDAGDTESGVPCAAT